MNWISVKEDLPIRQQNIIVYGKSKLFEVKYFDVFQGFFPEYITHWMPVEFPKEDKK